MKRLHNNQYQMITRVDDFLSKSVRLFPDHTAAVEVLELLRSGHAKLSEFLGTRVASELTLRSVSDALKAARESLFTLLDAMHRTARAVGVHKFYVTTRVRNQALINSARGFKEEATRMKDQLVFHGLPADFIESLQARVETFERAIVEHGAAKSVRAGCIEEFEKTLKFTLDQVIRLDALVFNTLADDAMVMKAWNAARRVEFPTRPKASEPAPEPAPTA